MLKKAQLATRASAGRDRDDLEHGATVPIRVLRFGFDMAFTITGESAYDIGTYTVTAP